MNIKVINLLKSKIELSYIKKRTLSLSSEEKANQFKILNIVISWWLKNIDENKLSDELLLKLTNFKEELALSILKKITFGAKEVKLYTDYFPEAIINDCLIKSDCAFISSLLPIKSTMLIYEDKIWINERTLINYRFIDNPFIIYLKEVNNYDDHMLFEENIIKLNKKNNI